ncbi:MAG: O-methyltransferase [Phycisphaeraceae bacterium]|nr:O-methyltransferase [Phycisphaeraceae bacterium]
MSQALWSSIDGYFNDALMGSDPELGAALERARAASLDAGLPDIAVAANQGRLLSLLVLAMGARNVLEIGTLGGYSAICLARALPAGGRLVTLEADAKHAAVARANIVASKPACEVEVVEGAALLTVPGVIATSPEAFDLVFIDADKQNIPAYVEHAIGATRSGGVIVVDNVVRDGRVLEESDDPSVAGVRRLVEMLRGDRRVQAAALQTVGEKGHDGFLVAVVR